MKPLEQAGDDYVENTESEGETYLSTPDSIPIMNLRRPSGVGADVTRDSVTTEPGTVPGVRESLSLRQLVQKH